jgi:hypothetical protein
MSETSAAASAAAYQIVRGLLGVPTNNLARQIEAVAVAAAAHIIDDAHHVQMVDASTYRAALRLADNVAQVIENAECSRLAQPDVIILLRRELERWDVARQPQPSAANEASAKDGEQDGQTAKDG